MSVCDRFVVPLSCIPQAQARKLENAYTLCPLSVQHSGTAKKVPQPRYNGDLSSGGDGSAPSLPQLNFGVGQHNNGAGIKQHNRQLKRWVFVVDQGELQLLMSGGAADGSSLGCGEAEGCGCLAACSRKEDRHPTIPPVEQLWALSSGCG